MPHQMCARSPFGYHSTIGLKSPEIKDRLREAGLTPYMHLTNVLLASYEPS